MLARSFCWRRLRPVALLLVGGIICQTTSCASLGAEVYFGVTNSIVNEFIRNWVSQAFGTNTGLNFGSFL